MTTIKFIRTPNVALWTTPTRGFLYADAVPDFVGANTKFPMKMLRELRRLYARESYLYRYKIVMAFLFWYKKRFTVNKRFVKVILKELL